MDKYIYMIVLFINSLLQQIILQWNWCLKRVLVGFGNSCLIYWSQKYLQSNFHLHWRPSIVSLCSFIFNRKWWFTVHFSECSCIPSVSDLVQQKSVDDISIFSKYYISYVCCAFFTSWHLLPIKRADEIKIFYRINIPTVSSKSTVWSFTTLCFTI